MESTQKLLKPLGISSGLYSHIQRNLNNAIHLEKMPQLRMT